MLQQHRRKQAALWQIGSGELICQDLSCKICSQFCNRSPFGRRPETGPPPSPRPERRALGDGAALLADLGPAGSTGVDGEKRFDVEKNRYKVNKIKQDFFFPIFTGLRIYNMTNMYLVVLYLCIDIYIYIY